MQYGDRGQHLRGVGQQLGSAGQQLGRPGKTPVFPIGVMRFLAKGGDFCKTLGWSDPPITSFRLNNMLTGAHYPIEKTQEVVGELPFSLLEGVQQTLDWMATEKITRR